MLQCLLHFATWPIQHWQLVKFSIAPCQIYNFTLSNHHFDISSFTLQTWQVYVILRAAQFFGLPPPNPLIAQVFLKFFLPKLCFFGLLTLGWVGACISGLPSYLLTYILTNLHTHLGYLSTYLPTYLGVDPYPHLPTSLQIYKTKNPRNYKSIITNCKFSSLQIYKIKI